MKRIFSSLLASILVLTLCVGCGSNDDQTGDANGQDGTGEGGSSIFTTLTDLDMNETVLEVDGNGIPADLYLYWVMNKSYELEYQLNMFKLSYGMYGENVDEEGRIKWDQTLDGDPVADIVRQNAENNALSYALLENVAKAHDIELTAEDQAAIDELLAQQAEQSGGEEAFEQSLYEMGISKESHTRMVASQYLYQHLAELAGDPASDIYQAPSDDDAYVDHILLATKDLSTGEDLSEEEAAAKREKAEDLLDQLISSRALVDFNQGLDARLLTPENIDLINAIRLKDIHFAWDYMKERKAVLKGLNLYAERATRKVGGAFATVYTLVNYDTSMDENMYRIYLLDKLGYLPYVMIYDKPNAPQEITDLQRWCNSRFIYKGTGKDFSKYRPRKCQTFIYEKYKKPQSDDEWEELERKAGVRV